ncbi:DUF551 domain-containing protein [Burkholderia multivorans]|uniref:DUF551 domain-containing protein n=1 Tax=Burkholderia multivorans TaxID=87883 RepID=UPI001B952305|nr:DUF551 domain-containing protein [Burkholderia multivorans]MBR8123268.1 DUF551 domain-containing protein [Burkholderia multivorans]MBU9600293.1 DUF551 domain-containing protein [Burkholderia multivorans]
MPGKLTDEQSAILIASAHRLDEVSSRYLAEELRFVLRELLAPAQQPSGEATDTAWISVDERLPKFDRKAGSFGTEVLIWPPMESGERTAFFGRRVGTKPSFYRYGAPVYGVTHWMPLPDAPAAAARAQGGKS